MTDTFVNTVEPSHQPSNQYSTAGVVLHRRSNRMDSKILSPIQEHHEDVLRLKYKATSQEKSFTSKRRLDNIKTNVKQDGNHEEVSDGFVSKQSEQDIKFVKDKETTDATMIKKSSIRMKTHKDFICKFGALRMSKLILH